MACVLSPLLFNVIPKLATNLSPRESVKAGLERSEADTYLFVLISLGVNKNKELKVFLRITKKCLEVNM
jgi:hypothetical protein